MLISCNVLHNVSKAEELLIMVPRRCFNTQVFPFHLENGYCCIMAMSHSKVQTFVERGLRWARLKIETVAMKIVFFLFFFFLFFSQIKIILVIFCIQKTVLICCCDQPTFFQLVFNSPY